MRSLLLLFSLLQTSGLAAAIPQTHGVHPSLLSKYRPTGATWTCLDGTKTISWTAVNDDYCDCPDGSDEPGASSPAVVLPKPYKPNQERVRVRTTPSTV
jgi:protein kinase C substrate 80K-H